MAQAQRKTANQLLQAWLLESNAPLKLWGALEAIKRGKGDEEFLWPEPGERLLTRTDEPSA